VISSRLANKRYFWGKVLIESIAKNTNSKFVSTINYDEKMLQLRFVAITLTTYITPLVDFNDVYVKYGFSPLTI